MLSAEEELTDIIDGDNPSITNAFVLLIELAPPLTGKVKSAPLLSLSNMVPPFNDNAAVLV